MDIYQVQKSNPDIFRQINLKDQLVLYYSCPQRDQILQLYAKHNQLAFTISGKRIIHHGDNTWVTDKSFGLLVKRCAFLQELPPDYSGWKVLVMYLKDDYLKRVFDEFRPHLNLVDLPEVDKLMMQEISINEQVRNCYESLIPYFVQPHLLPDSIFEGKFRELLFNILANPANRQILTYINQIT